MNVLQANGFVLDVYQSLHAWTCHVEHDFLPCEQHIYYHNTLGLVYIVYVQDHLGPSEATVLHIHLMSMLLAQLLNYSLPQLLASYFSM